MKCEVIFDANRYGVYFSGDLVTGKFVLQTEKTKSVKEIVLKVVGYAHTSWSESTTTSSTDANGKTTSHTTTTTYSAREDYLDSCTCLAKSDRGQSIDLSSGTYTYNFMFRLPINCPTSFEGMDGHIRYKVKVILVRPWKFDQTHSVGFTVLKMVDLNFESPLLRIPTNMETFKQFCCGPCRSKPLHITADVPQTGYVPGQAIKVNVYIHNPTDVQIKEIRIALNLEVTCFSTFPIHKSKSEIVCLAKTKTIVNSTSLNLSHSDYIQVPATPPTCMSLCSIIQIAYVIEVKTSVSGPHINPTIRIPITIGNVPLSNSYHMQRGQPHPEATAPLPEMLTNFDNVAIFNSLDMNLPPPSYETAMYMTRINMNEDEKHPIEDMDFAPRFPVYNFNVSSNGTEFLNENSGNSDNNKFV